jgi:hypothetical protein
MMPSVPLISVLPTFVNSCVAKLTPGNLIEYSRELLKCGDLFGSVGRVCLLKTLLAKTDFSPKTSTDSEGFHDLLRLIWLELSALPNFRSLLAQALPVSPPRPDYIDSVVRELDLTLASQVQLLLSVCEGLTRSWRFLGFQSLTAFLSDPASALIQSHPDQIQVDVLLLGKELFGSDPKTSPWC